MILSKIIEEKINQENLEFEKLFQLWVEYVRENKRAVTFRPNNFYGWIRKQIGNDKEKEIHCNLRTIWNKKIKDGFLIQVETDKQSYRFNN